MKLAFRSQVDKDRFMQKVHIREDGCWEWKAARFSKGYGQFSLGEFNHRAHRVSHWNFNGPFDETLDVMHSCDNTWCVCPEHISDGTNQDNRDDSYRKGRGNTGVRNGMSSLDEQQVNTIKQSKGTYEEIASNYLISPQTVGRIKRGETYV